MKMIRVGFIHESFPFGGGEKVTSNLAAFFADKNVRTYVFACRLQPSSDPDIQFCKFPDSRKVNTKANMDYLIQVAGELDLDILILPGVYLKDIKTLRQKIKAKFVFALHSKPMWEAINKYIIVEERSYQSWSKRIKWLLVQRPKYRLLNTHTKSFLNLYKRTFKFVDAYVVLCESYKYELLDLLKTDNVSKLLAIPNSVDTAPDIDLSVKQKEIIFVGRLSYADKRVDRLLDIWQGLCLKYPDWKLRIIGDGPELSALKNKVLEDDLKNVIFEGYHQNVVPFYRNASVICMTSSFEGWPLVLGEAQSYGVVPVAFNCSAGVADILSPDGVNGILVPPFDMELYTKQLGRLMSDDQLRLKIAEAVILKSKEYSPDIIGKKWLDLFQTLTSK